MLTIRQIVSTLRVLLGRARFERDMDEEITAHIAMMADQLAASGLPRPEAERQARASFGAVQAFKEEARASRGVHWLDLISADLRHSIRALRRTPGYTAIALLTLALGIGGTTAMFSLINALLFRPLPFQNPEQLVGLFIEMRESAAEPAQPFAWSYPKYVAMRDRATSFDGMTGFSTSNVNLGGDEPERLTVEFVSGDYFKVLGISATLGRPLTRSDDSIPRAHPVVVLTQGLWRRRFGSDSGVVGRAVTIGATTFTVIGVAPPGFAGLSGGADAFLPMMMAPLLEYDGLLTEGQNHWFSVVARLKDGVGLERARSEMATLGRQVDDQFRGSEQAVPWSATAEPLAGLRADPSLSRASWILFGATGIVLLIGAINLANLLLIRSAGRRRELAVRSAIGASHAGLVRHLLTEGLVLSLVGAGLGIAVAWLTIPMLTRLGPSGGGANYLVDTSAVAIDGRVLAFALGASLLTGLGTGLWPAWRAARLGRTEFLHHVRVTGQTRRFGAAQMLVVSEAALAVTLVTGALLLVRSLEKLTAIDFGFQGDHVLTFRVSPGTVGLAGENPPQFRALALEQLRAIPGVEAAGSNACLPLQGQCSVSVIQAFDDQRLAETDRREVGVHVVGPGYFETLRIPLIAGRLFDGRDRIGAPKGVIINEATAKRLWPGVNPVGRTIRVATYYFQGDSSVAVIGVVGDVRYGSATEPAGPDIYLPTLQTRFGPATFVVRVSGDPLAVVESARRVILGIDPGLPIFSVRTMDEVTRGATARNRFATALLGLFSAVALLLAALGVYGVLGYSVTARAREIGIRMAIGAERGQVLGLVLGQGMVPIALGLVIGLVVAGIGSRVLGSLLFGIGPTDPLAFGAGAGVLLTAGLLASYLPARRAARVDPNIVLRED